MNFKILGKTNNRTEYLKALSEQDAKMFCEEHGYFLVERFRGRVPASVKYNCLCTDNWFNRNF